MYTKINVGNRLAGYYQSNGIDYEIKMNSEYYDIDLIFTVVESPQNMQAGSMFVTSKITSYNSIMKPLIFNRMGNMYYKGSINL